MRFSVRHETIYRYSVPVRLGSHVLRLNPRADGARVLAASLTIDPAPAERHEQTDRFGNHVTQVGFVGLADHLHIENYFDLDIIPAAPLRDPGLPPLPWPLRDSGRRMLPWPSRPDDGLAEYRADGDPDRAVQAFAHALATDSGSAALPFLDRLSQALFTRMDRHIRVEGAAQTPAQTLATGRGACRDLTVLFMAACRALGIAARFVSGYQAQADTPDGQRHLHAWPEVFLPGLGWRGFDPTHGIAVSDGHAALCAAPNQAAAMPVEGGFFGNGVTATLDYRVQIASTDDRVRIAST